MQHREIDETSKVKVYLPIYVIGKMTDNSFGYGIRVTMSELENKSSRFLVLQQRINEALNKTDFQVGINNTEVNKIIEQHSWYKDNHISFVGCVEIALSLDYLNARACESSHRPTPYFSIQKGSQIELEDITTFLLTNQRRVGLALRVDELIFSIGRGEVINNNDNAMSIIAPTKFDYAQSLNSRALIDEALSQYQKEYEITVQYDTQYADVLEDIKKLRDIHQQNALTQQKIVDQLKTIQSKRGGRFRKIIDDMIEYYEATAMQKKMQTLSSTASVTGNASTFFGQTELSPPVVSLQANNTVIKSYDRNSSLQ